MADNRLAMARLFVKEDLSEGQFLGLKDNAYHYLYHVLRYRVGQSLRVFNGKDGEYAAVLTAVSKKEALVTVQHLLRPQEILPSLGLYISPLRPVRMTILLEKITELGITDIYPVKMDHTAHPLQDPLKLKRQLIEAAEQSERLCVPALHPLVSLRDVIALRQPIVWAYERSAMASSPMGGIRSLLIGPEGGFSATEIAALRACPSIKEISLGPHILRAETAAIVGTFLLSLK